MSLIYLTTSALERSVDKHTFFCAFCSNAMWRYYWTGVFFCWNLILLTLNIPTTGFEPVIICSVAKFDSDANHDTPSPWTFNLVCRFESRVEIIRIIFTHISWEELCETPDTSSSDSWFFWLKSNRRQTSILWSYWMIRSPFFSLYWKEKFLFGRCFHNNFEKQPNYSIQITLIKPQFDKTQSVENALGCKHFAQVLIIVE